MKAEESDQLPMEVVSYQEGNERLCCLVFRKEEAGLLLLAIRDRYRSEIGKAGYYTGRGEEEKAAHHRRCVEVLHGLLQPLKQLVAENG